ncbi:MAG: DUF2141 domain-containing protein [Pseudomonadota bacterium]
MLLRCFAAALVMGLAAPVWAECAAGDETRLEVSVQNVRSSSGNVTITVYENDRQKFLASGAKLVRDRAPAQAGVTRSCLPVPGPGTYAVAVYHDEDGDRDFDRNALGLPQEGYGFSNDAPTLMSLPSFEDVVFEAGSGTTPLTITMRY